MSTALTRSLGEFIANLKYTDIPADGVAVIKTGFADCVGVMFAGASEPLVTILTETFNPVAGEARLHFGPRTAPAPQAAWINGAAAHALDYDDVALRGHPSTVLVPAILAEAQALGASGEEMIAAYAAGYETWGELVSRDQDHYHAKGWHPTGILGAIGAAAACARLNKLSPEQCTQAIALGASQSAGLMSNFGTMTKPFHAGHAAHAGVLAARLVKRGFTAAVDALEHTQGYLAALSPKGRFDAESPLRAGKEWQILKAQLGIKKYPLCYCTHRALDGIHDLVKAHQVAVDSIQKVIVNTSRLNTTILKNHRPQTGLEAKFSMEFAMASVLVRGRAGLNELQDDFVQTQEVQALMRKVEVVPDDREDPEQPGRSPYDLVTIEVADGRKIESPKVRDIRGGPVLPLSRDDLWTKFSDCVRVSKVKIDAAGLFETLMSLEKLDDASKLPHYGG